MSIKQFLSLVWLLLAAMVAPAQEQDVRNDSTVDVIGWFCTGDTLVYRFSSVRAEVAGTDTTVTESNWNKFRICVKDSTKKEYLMEYTPLGVSVSDSTSAQGRIRLLSARSLLGTKVLYKTTGLGTFKEIVNWKEVYNDILANSMRVVDQIYLENPTLPSVKTKPEMLKELRELCAQLYGSKEKLAEAFMAPLTLFSYHGKEFPVGENDAESDEGRVHYDITKGMLDGEETSDDDEYQLYMKVDMPDSAGVKTTIYYSYRYFADGWPRDYLVTLCEENNGKETITQMNAEWESKSWK